MPRQPLVEVVMALLTSGSRTATKLVEVVMTRQWVLRHLGMENRETEVLVCLVSSLADAL